jgi:hypothetical protein
MTSPAPKQGPAPAAPAPSSGKTRRVVLWLVVFGALTVGVILALIYGPRVTPFLDVTH